MTKDGFDIRNPDDFDDFHDLVGTEGVEWLMGTSTEALTKKLEFYKNAIEGMKNVPNYDDETKKLLTENLQEKIEEIKQKLKTSMSKTEQNGETEMIKDKKFDLEKIKEAFAEKDVLEQTLNKYAKKNSIQGVIYLEKSKSLRGGSTGGSTFASNELLATALTDGAINLSKLMVMKIEKEGGRLSEWKENLGRNLDGLSSKYDGPKR